jgi:hypothetical protein
MLQTASYAETVLTGLISLYEPPHNFRKSTTNAKGTNLTEHHFTNVHNLTSNPGVGIPHYARDLRKTVAIPPLRQAQGRDLEKVRFEIQKDHKVPSPSQAQGRD